MLGALPGRIVRSAAGHDKGKFMVAVRADKDFVYLADGKERKLESPKKKRLKHINPTNTVIDMRDLTDKRLRGIIAEFTSGRSEDD
ncbi:MAG: KOW domain-containing RNA-binding protein [Oscillospiraceae bacterium]|nr:KOW domain-containing RNA-binding protein [Oscillospiraceae bacterium]